MAVNEKRLGVSELGKVAIKEDDYHIGEKYDSASEPEAVGRQWEQSEAGEGYATMDAAKARKTDLPRQLDSEWGSGTDLLSGAPLGGDVKGSEHPDESDG